MQASSQNYIDLDLDYFSRNYINVIKILLSKALLMINQVENILSSTKTTKKL